MNNSLRVLMAICIVWVLSLWGCASMPEEQLKAATDAMNQATELRAELYVPAEWKDAKDLWDQAQDQLSKQQYAAAKETLMRARARFAKVKESATAERESLLKQVNNIQANITANYDTFKANKQANANKKEFQAACADIDKRIGIIKEAVDKGDFITAKSEGQNALVAIEFNLKKLGGATAGTAK